MRYAGRWRPTKTSRESATTFGRDSAVYARDVASRLYDAVGVLATYPDSGRVVPERKDPSLRELVRAPYRIVYRRRADVVEILTVFHGAQQFPSRLPSSEG